MGLELVHVCVFAQSCFCFVDIPRITIEATGILQGTMFRLLMPLKAAKSIRPNAKEQVIRTWNRHHKIFFAYMDDDGDFVLEGGTLLPIEARAAPVVRKLMSLFQGGTVAFVLAIVEAELENDAMADFWENNGGLFGTRDDGAK